MTRGTGSWPLSASCDRQHLPARSRQVKLRPGSPARLPVSGATSQPLAADAVAGSGSLEESDHLPCSRDAGLGSKVVLVRSHPRRARKGVILRPQSWRPRPPPDRGSSSSSAAKPRHRRCAFLRDRHGWRPPRPPLLTLGSTQRSTVAASPVAASAPTGFLDSIGIGSP